MAASIDPLRFIAAKRDGRAHEAEEIREWIRAYVQGEIGEEQMAAWAMAVYLNGMTPVETAALTEAMWHSGTTLQWPAGSGPYVDKHSTGGIGDKISLILAPLLACCDVRVPMLSGRGLGPTGGTLDKLESIPGFRTDLSLQELQQVVASCGCVITGTTPQIAPADRKLYALRDVTATVASIPLITASIMSKKLSEGLDALVLDVKFGSGAFMKTRDKAQALAESLVATGERVGVACRAILSDMNQPLGRMVGNACEVDESLEVLEGGGPLDVRELTLELGAELLEAAQVAPSREAARVRLEAALDTGAAREKFSHMVAAQGGSLDAPRPRAPAIELDVPQSGVVRAIDAEALGYAVIALGGGRRRLGEAIDHSVGLEYLVRIGDRVEAGQPWIRMFARDRGRDEARCLLEAAIKIDERDE